MQSEGYYDNHNSALIILAHSHDFLRRNNIRYSSASFGVSYPLLHI